MQRADIHSGRNAFGAISYARHGNSSALACFTQVFANGEIWGVTGEFVVQSAGQLAIRTASAEESYHRTLASYIEFAREALKQQPPYDVVLGATGVNGVHLGVPNRAHFSSFLGPIYQDAVTMEMRMATVDADAQRKLLDAFFDKLFDSAGAKRGI